MRNCNVTKGWVVINGGGRYFSFVAIQKKLSQLLLTIVFDHLNFTMMILCEKSCFSSYLGNPISHLDPTSKPASYNMHKGLGGVTSAL